MQEYILYLSQWCCFLSYMSGKWELERLSKLPKDMELVTTVVLTHLTQSSKTRVYFQLL